jgi:hypothetical protein
MKYLLTLYLVTTTVFANGQGSIDYGQLVNSWTQGKIDQHGQVTQADMQRGGWYQLKINHDSTVAFSAPDNCGFGEGKREGRWKLNIYDTTITFLFSTHIGYMAYPGTSFINEIETYKIRKLNAGVLIILLTSDKNGRLMPFTRTKN